MDKQQKLEALAISVRTLLENNKDKLLFHGWHHVNFVAKKGREFAQSISANAFLVESAAYVHDLNYLERPNSEPEEGKQIRQNLLHQAGYTDEEINRIEEIVMEEHIKTRSETLSDEGKALSDADTLFKSLPITPVLLSSKYIAENNASIQDLAQKIVSEQKPLMESGIYFYTNEAKKYLSWATTNLNLWEGILNCYSDSDIKELINALKD